ncbi:hypothetical protein [Spirochaeta isovalerica]|uniref:Uncharacterized protein n=1 Tax=Spirochaeta isovalerica TaxID=150 RepID=A0A841RDZ5_9SPIO|nr:hypothetical protein [Spirochaeta isovalerica]MBB6482285.1 hypothetical protein [Spirochaeta isovalerica]
MENQYYLIRKTEELDGTCYFEFLPGKYQDKCWNSHSVYLTEDSAAFVEDIFHQISNEYDHYSFTELNKEQIQLFLTLIDSRISKMKSTKQYKLESTIFSEYYYNYLMNDYIKYKKQIITLLFDFKIWLSEIIQSYDRITIMGL